MSQGVSNPSITVTPSAKVAAMFPGDYSAADEGSFFTSYLGATTTTAVALTSNTIANANPILAIQNQWPPGGYSIYLRYVKMFITAVSTSNTSVNYATSLDPLQVKLTTVGTALSAPANVNSNSGVASKAALWSGVNVAAALSANARQIGSGQVASAIDVAFDEYIFHFGQPVFGGDMIGSVSAVKRISVSHAPVVIAPQWWFTLGVWGASWAASAWTFAIEVGWIERPSGQ